MLEWIQGTVFKVNDPKSDDPFELHTLDVIDDEQGYLISRVQIPVINAIQDLPAEGSTVLIYRDSSAVYKMAVKVTDPRPISSPIKDQTAKDIIATGERTFLPGEVAFAALGDDSTFLPTQGSTLWLKNSGDAALTSGSYGQCISVNDSTESVDIEGTNVGLQATGNDIATHTLVLETNELGFTSSTWGLANPLTGIFTSGINISSVGSIAIGVFDPVLGISISGFEFNNLLQSTRVTSVSHSVTAARINMAAGVFDVEAGSIGFLGFTSVKGAFGVTGTTDLVGNVDIVGISTFVGNMILPAVANGIITVGGVPGFTGTVATPTSITVVNGIVIAVT